MIHRVWLAPFPGDGISVHASWLAESGCACSKEWMLTASMCVHRICCVPVFATQLELGRVTLRVVSTAHELLWSLATSLAGKWALELPLSLPTLPPTHHPLVPGRNSISFPNCRGGSLDPGIPLTQHLELSRLACVRAWQACRPVCPDSDTASWQHVNTCAAPYKRSMMSRGKTTCCCDIVFPHQYLWIGGEYV